MVKQAKDLVEGDVIDLVPALGIYTDIDIEFDISGFEYAVVEFVLEETPDCVIVVTDQHNVALPPSFEFCLPEG